MRTFNFFIDDDRYSVPTFNLVTVADVHRALETAEKLMRDSEHHLGVEVLDGEVRVFGIGSQADRNRPGIIPPAARVL